MVQPSPERYPALHFHPVHLVRTSPECGAMVFAEPGRWKEGLWQDWAVRQEWRAFREQPTASVRRVDDSRMEEWKLVSVVSGERGTIKPAHHLAAGQRQKGFEDLFNREIVE